MSGNAVSAMMQRGLVANVTNQGIVQHVDQPTAIYCGVDPTAKSLHLGNLVTLMGLLHFHVRGHQTIALVGGATGSIGDPSGRQSERVPLGKDVLDENVRGIERQIHRFFANGAAYAQRRGLGGQLQSPLVLNNYAWFSTMTALDFLGQVGRHARVSTMLAKERQVGRPSVVSVKSRIESAQGISFTEFSYQLLQAYDFDYLYRHHACRIQLGGSDQWGNITAGIDMIARRGVLNDTKNGKGDEDKEEAQKAFGITIPLLLTNSGDKFGKSAGNAVWLDETMTSLFDFYQFFMKTADADVGTYLSMFTLLSRADVDRLLAEHQQHPEQRRAQQVLANEMTELVHGLEAVQKAQTATRILFGQDPSSVAGQDIVSAFENDPHRLATLERSKVVGARLDVVATQARATQSKSDAQKRIKAGGLYLNHTRITDPHYTLKDTDLIDGQVCVLRIGKSSYHLVHAISSS